MFSPCVEVALVTLFPAKLVSLHSDFPSSSYRGFRVAGKEKEKRKGVERYYRGQYQPSTGMLTVSKTACAVSGPVPLAVVPAGPTRLSPLFFFSATRKRQ
jgi:hypothetical protein